MDTTNDTDKGESESIKTTLFEEFSKIKLMMENQQDIQVYINNKELLTKNDQYNDILMHLVCSSYIQDQTQINFALLHNVKEAYKNLSLDPNPENNFGVTPAEIIGDVDYDLAEELFA